MLVEYKDIDSHGKYRYQVGDDGNVRRLLSGDVWRPILGVLTKHGYVQYKINKRIVFGHVLVALAFLGPKNGKIVRHLNGRPDDNRLVNLAYGTHVENENDKLLHGRRLRGQKVGNSKLTDDNVRNIKKMLCDGVRQDVIAGVYGITQACVSSIKRGKIWSHITAVS